jgi:hypothetical protein
VLRRRAGEVDLDLVATDGDGAADRQLAVDRLDSILGFPASVRQLGDRRADDPLRIRVELVHRARDVVSPAAVDQLREPLVGEAVRCELRAQIAAALVRMTHVRRHQLEHFVREPQRRDHEALLVQLARAGGEARRLHAADIRMVRARDGVAELRARDERDVRQVRTAGKWIVEDEDVADARPAGHHCGDRVRHRAEVHGDVLGLRDHPPLLVEERCRAVAALLDIGRKGRADQDDAHLLGDRAKRGADHLERDGYINSHHVRLSTSVPCASVSPRQPAGTQQVAPGSSTSRGPSTL